MLENEPRFNEVMLTLKASFWMSRGRDVIWRRRRLLSCLLCEVCCVLGRFFGFNYKIMIKVQESPPSIMVTRNLWSARVWVRDWLCKGKTHHPQCTLPKVSCIVVWLFFSKSGFYSLVFSKAQSRSLFMRKSLPYQVKSWPF